MTPVLAAKPYFRRRVIFPSLASPLFFSAEAEGAFPVTPDQIRPLGKTLKEKNFLTVVTLIPVREDFLSKVLFFLWIALSQKAVSFLVWKPKYLRDESFFFFFLRMSPFFPPYFLLRGERRALASYPRFLPRVSRTLFVPPGRECPFSNDRPTLSFPCRRSPCSSVVGDFFFN